MEFGVQFFPGRRQTSSGSLTSALSSTTFSLTEAIAPIQSYF